jgi:hypothetical protein
MKTNQTAMALLISILITIISVSPDLAQSANQQKNLSVEGEWELISTNTTAIRKDIGQRLSISRQGDGYEVKWLDGRSAVTYSGNDTRIVHTFLEDLGKGGGSEGGPPIPASVLQQVTGQKAPINKSYTLSGDGLVLQGECDIFWFYWWKKTGRFERYEIAPGYSKTTFKRVSGPAVAPKASPAPAPPTIAAAPAKKTATSAVAQVEAWGEYYFLTKDGRKLTGAEAGKVPLEEGGKVVTGKAGHVRLTLPDDTTWTVGPNSDLVIDPFVYDADKTPQQVMVDMTKGGVPLGDGQDSSPI